MPRYSQLDSDEEHLPEGMQRVGYDADSQTYTYRDQEGSFWEGEPGARYGVLRPSGSGYQPMTVTAEQEMRRADKAAWRYMLPFFLLVMVVLFTLFKYLGFGSGMFPAPLSCQEGFMSYVVKSGDSCWQIAHDRGMEVADLVKSNEGLNCDLLKAGKEICVPVEGDSRPALTKLGKVVMSRKTEGRTATKSRPFILKTIEFTDD